MPEKHTRQLGRYQLLTLLASGGMADIFLARHLGIKGFERLVVIKKIHPHLARSEQFVEMFFDEARIAAKLNHPNIVHISDLGAVDEEFFIAMEYLEGESLGFLVREGKKTESPLPQELAAGILAQVCDGLDYAHSLTDGDGTPMNIVHRDISPQNIIVLYSGLVKLVDFGIAKASSQVHETHTGALRGKLKYMSPEQCKSGPLDARSDVFSLGVVLWELLTRQRLFKGNDEVALLQAINTQPIPHAKQIRPEVSLGFADIADKALQRNLDTRYRTAGAMGAAIREVIRREGHAAGVAEISAYAKKILAGRERTKKDILQALQKESDTPLPIRILRPETAEASMGQFEDQTADSMAGDTAASNPDATRSMGAEELSQLLDQPDRAWSGNRVWLTVSVVVILLLLGLLAWMMARPDDRPVSIGPPAATTEEEAVLTPQPIAPTPTGDAGVTGGPETGKKSPAVRRRRRRNRRRRFGFLRLSTEPWSVVYRGKRKLGITPLAGVKLRAGKHRLVAVNRKEKIRKAFTIRIRPGKTTILKLNLKDR